MTENEDEIVLTTADMLEIYASGGNGSEHVDGPALLTRAANELRAYADELEKMTDVMMKYMKTAERLSLEGDDLRSFSAQCLQEVREAKDQRNTTEMENVHLRKALAADNPSSKYAETVIACYRLRKQKMRLVAILENIKEGSIPRAPGFMRGTCTHRLLIIDDCNECIKDYVTDQLEKRYME
jgi:hypothetical protein